MKNYIGDRLNFGLAAELARAEGIPVELVAAADVALHATVPPERRRGIVGTVLIHKLAGAAAAAGMDLAQVAAIARDAADDLGSMGVALGACTVPAAGRPGFELTPAEIELGLGIHGEQGVERPALAALDVMRDRGPAGPLIARLAAMALAVRDMRLHSEPVNPSNSSKNARWNHGAFLGDIAAHGHSFTNSQWRTASVPVSALVPAVRADAVLTEPADRIIASPASMLTGGT